MWWELLMLWRQLYLVGFALLVRPGTVEQLVISFLIALSMMLLFAVAAPFKDDGDDYFAQVCSTPTLPPSTPIQTPNASEPTGWQACSFALTAVFFFLLVIKFGVLANSVDQLLAGQLRDKFYFDIHLVTVGMMAAILMALILAAVMAAQQIAQAASVPTIRLQRTKAPPDLPLADGHRWHMFLSHIWATGQDQCATIRRQLRIMLPGASVFLDVDDLKSIDALEEYVAQSSVVMIFASAGYFLSKNCMREVS